MADPDLRDTLDALARAADAAAVALVMTAWAHRPCDACVTRCSRAATLIATALEVLLAQLEDIDPAHARAVAADLLALHATLRAAPRHYDVADAGVPTRH
jgi:hypothetical protein